jgi:hypothetical protein
LFTNIFRKSFNDTTEDEGESPHTVIHNVENALRKCIYNELNSRDPNWWKNLIPNDIRMFVEERMSKSRTVDKNYVQYLDFSDYIKIIANRNNWQYFEKYFGIKEKFEFEMDELRLIRNSVAHNRTLTEMDLKKLYLYSEEIMSNLK